MSWAVGFDSNWKRDIGYGVPATCDRPGCGTGIDRGLAYVCGGQPYGGEEGCGLYFCGYCRVDRAQADRRVMGTVARRAPRRGRCDEGHGQRAAKLTCGALAPVPGGLPLPAAVLSLPTWLADWLVGRERELAAAGDAEAEARLEALLEGER
jgi:hypothetical protein